MTQKFDPAKVWNLREVSWEFNGERVVGAWQPRGMPEWWYERALDEIRRDLLPECAATLTLGP